MLQSLLAVDLRHNAGSRQIDPDRHQHAHDPQLP